MPEEARPLGVRRDRGINHERVRAANRSAILRLLASQGAMTRHNIALQMSLTEASVSRIIAECIDAGLVTETGSVSAPRGRPSITVSLSTERYALAAVHIGLVWLDFALVDLQQQIVAFRREIRPTDMAPRNVINLIATVLGELRREGAPRRLLAAGLTINASIDPQSAMIGEDNLPGWPPAPLGIWLEELLGVPVFLENDINAMALTEYHQRQECDLLVCINVGMALSMGVVHNGRIFRGLDGTSNRIRLYPMSTGCPHLPIQVAGQLADGFLVEAANRLGHNFVTALDMLAAAGSDARVQDMLDCRSKGLADLLSAISFLLNPNVIVLTGVTVWGETFRAVAAHYRDAHPPEHISDLCLGTFGERETVVSSAHIALLNVLSPDLSFTPDQNGQLTASYPALGI